MLIKYFFYGLILTSVIMTVSLILFPDSTKEITEWGLLFGMIFSAGILLLPFLAGRPYYDGDN